MHFYHSDRLGRIGDVGNHTLTLLNKVRISIVFLKEVIWKYEVRLEEIQPLSASSFHYDMAAYFRDSLRM